MSDATNTDSRSAAERFYDDEIAPALLAIAERCREHGMSLVATVEFEPGERATTSCMTEHAGIAMVMLQHCAKMGENVDGYIFGLARYAERKGIDSRASMVMNWANSGR